ncbi:metabotropic glutamate receptor 7-like [Amphiura filiformis]|uniref:metabotropic glutamate receptor 7-like n=1 Tax=Amphiura filiformis TaxID=82378 RepID=UPI003B21BBA8
MIEAMVFAVDEINERFDILPHHTLGFDIRDDCNSEDKALEAAVDLLSDPGKGGNEVCVITENRTVGIVGPDSSIHSILVGSMCDLKEIPLISYGATYKELSDKTIYEYFSRSIPPQHNEALAISDLISHFGWKYVSIIYSTDSYGIDNGLLLQQLLSSKGICIGYQGPIPITSEGMVNIDFVKTMTETLSRSRSSRVIVVFTDAEVANFILDAMTNIGLLVTKFTWIGCSKWEQSLHLTIRKDQSNRVPVGGLFLNIWKPVPKAFERYLQNLNTSPSFLNPWIQNIQNVPFIVTEEYNSLYSTNSTRKSKAGPVIDAVYAFAYALHAMLESSYYPNSSSSCNITDKENQGSDFLSYLRNVDFNGTRGRFRFDQAGDFWGTYVFKNLQLIDNQPTLVEVGHWNGVQVTKLRITDTKIMWANNQREIPFSTCTPTCKPGKKPVLKSDGCCHYCRSCGENTIIVNEECQQCGFLEWRDENRTVCNPITPSGTDLYHPVIMGLIVMSSLGLLLCIATIAGLTKYRYLPLVKATSRELSLVNLTGLILAFTCIGPFLIYPSEVSCSINEAIIALCLAFTFVPTFLKVSRIYRIFKAGKRTVKRPRFTGPKSQLLLAGLLIGIQIILLLTTMADKATKSTLIFPVIPDGSVTIYCRLE